MNRILLLRPVALALALAAAAAPPARAQTEIVAQTNPDADRLAEQVRILASDPRNINALLEAGNLSARINDVPAALAFFQRAESVDPSNPRILAGRASALVRLERPGEALRLFQSAEARGVSMADYVADRGLAYDLLGSPELAQRDYRQALQRDRDDETVRRYALSLGIAGKKDEAMRELDPLLRRSDRAAWRARAFVMAMNGDVEGAEKIAANMMPGNMGLALVPFFRRIGNLSPADQAFAVNFGELTPTQARIADAKLAPALPRFVPDARPVQVAAAPPAGGSARDRRSRRDRAREARPAPAVTRQVEAARAESPKPPVQLAAREPMPTAETPAPVREPSPAPSPASRAAPPPERNTVVASRPAEPARQLAAAEPVRSVALPVAAQPAPRPVEPAPAPQPEPVAPPPAAVGQEDRVLAAIVANITIPGEELKKVTAVPTGPAPQGDPAPVVEEPVVEAPRPEPAKAAPAKVEPVKKPEPAKPAPKKPEPKKPEPKAKDPAKTDPARVWVQVAGGANEDMLPRAWKRAVEKAPAAFKGKTAWWTPLRATNRVLAGPFKNADEAQDFVNALAKGGASAFVFTSEAGQKISKLELK